MWTFILKSVILLSCGYVSQTANLSSSQPIPWSLLESVTGVSELSIDCVGVLKIDDLSPSNCSTCFGVIPKGTGTYALFYSPRNGASLDYDKANFYTFSMSCDEGGGIKNTGTVVLNVIPNFSPLFQDSSSIRTVTTGTVIGGVVYNPKPFDPENDQLTFTLEENPNNGFFTIDGNGIVRAKKNLNTFCNHQETITITMQDGTNPPVSKTVTLDPGGNTKPTFKDWNRIITIPENTVLDLRITDNLGTQGSCIVTVVPPEYSSYIDSTTKCPLGSSSSLRTPVGGKTFNYEVDPPLNISFVLDNGNCPSDPIWLFLQWSDVPEPPKLTLHKMDFITKEGMVEIEPEYVVQDDDQPDKHVYSFAEPELVNPNFKIDPDTGRIYTQKYYQMDCDLDKNGFVFKVQVTDKNGNVSAPPVNVKLNLTDVNDNRPRFTRRFDPTPISYPDCLQPFTLTDLSEDVTDDDCEVTTNKAVEFLEASSGSLSISKHGVVRLTKPPIAGQVDILQIRAIDKGEPPLLSETETISIRGFPCPTTQPAVVPVDNNNINYNNNNDNNNYNNDNNNYNNDNNNNNNNGVATTVVPEVVEAGFFDKPCIIALIALAGLLGLLLLPLLLYLYYRFCCRNACYKRRNPPLKANKIKPNKMGGDGGGNENSSSGGVGNGDGGESGYGGAVGDVVGDANEGKDFQDKGFKDQPSKKALPATVEKA